jgi:hypothetical protein
MPGAPLGDVVEVPGVHGDVASVPVHLDADPIELHRSRLPSSASASVNDADVGGIGCTGRPEGDGLDRARPSVGDPATASSRLPRTFAGRSSPGCPTRSDGIGHHAGGALPQAAAHELGQNAASVVVAGGTSPSNACGLPIRPRTSPPARSARRPPRRWSPRARLRFAHAGDGPPPDDGPWRLPDQEPDGGFDLPGPRRARSPAGHPAGVAARCRVTAADVATSRRTARRCYPFRTKTTLKSPKQRVRPDAAHRRVGRTPGSAGLRPRTRDLRWAKR